MNRIQSLIFNYSNNLYLKFTGTQDLDTTVSGSAHSGEKKELPRTGFGYPQTSKELRSAIVRLAIVVPTLTV